MTAPLMQSSTTQHEREKEASGILMNGAASLRREKSTMADRSGWSFASSPSSPTHLLHLDSRFAKIKKMSFDERVENFVFTQKYRAKK
jgi:hypothetical protein